MAFPAIQYFPSESSPEEGVTLVTVPYMVSLVGESPANVPLDPAVEGKSLFYHSIYGSVIADNTTASAQTIGFSIQDHTTHKNYGTVIVTVPANSTQAVPFCMVLDVPVSQGNYLEAVAGVMVADTAITTFLNTVFGVVDGVVVPPDVE